MLDAGSARPEPAVPDADRLERRIGHNHTIAATKPEQTGVQLIGTGTVMRID